MQARIATAVAMATLLFVSATAESRDLIQMDFDGVVTQAGVTAGVTLVLGDPLHARVVFDTQAIDRDPSPLFGRYTYEFMEVFTSRGLVFRSGPSDPGSVAGLSIDRQIQRFQFTGIVAGAQHFNDVAVRFPPDTFADDRPPTTLPFATATEAHYTFSWVSPLARATLTSYSAAVVPEPTGWMLSACAMMAIATRRRRVRRQTVCSARASSAPRGGA
jgi:hypothetical protein